MKRESKNEGKDTAKKTKTSATENEEKEAVPEPITEEGQMPQKKYYRSRAHCNPFSYNDGFEYPTTPSHMDWSEHYPELSSDTAKKTTPNILDIGCGFGGLTLALAEAFPEDAVLGLEIRTKVAEYVRLRILAHRKESNIYRNCSVLRTNAMKVLPHCFPPHSVRKMFFCFPDPHFKKKNHSRRIITERLLSEYAFLLEEGVGRLYCVTDVKDLHDWQLRMCRSHPLFRELTHEEMHDDLCVKLMLTETEEGKKVQRTGAEKYYAVFQRVRYADLSLPITKDTFWDHGQFGVIQKETKN